MKAVAGQRVFGMGTALERIGMGGRDSMLSAALLLFANTLLFSLRLSGGGSFPKPLSAAEERDGSR